MYEISRQHSIQPMVWLLLNALIQIYSNKEKVIQNVKFRDRICGSKYKTVYHESTDDKASIILKEKASCIH